VSKKLQSLVLRNPRELKHISSSRKPITLTTTTSSTSEYITFTTTTLAKSKILQEYFYVEDTASIKVSPQADERAKLEKGLPILLSIAEHNKFAHKLLCHES